MTRPHRQLGATGLPSVTPARLRPLRHLITFAFLTTEIQDYLSRDENTHKTDMWRLYKNIEHLCTPVTNTAAFQSQARRVLGAARPWEVVMISVTSTAAAAECHAAQPQGREGHQGGRWRSRPAAMLRVMRGALTAAAAQQQFAQ